ncbi:MAG: peptidoglycan recognition family protein [Myxococcota bacterium]|nr:peptidoglycan recognition family protein [Myxococcota bacterium]
MTVAFAFLEGHAHAETGDAPDIHSWALPQEKQRKKLTVEYLKRHTPKHKLTGDITKDAYMTPRVIVLHWTGGDSLKATWNTFSGASLRGRKKLRKASSLNVGAHFLVDRDGSIYQLVDERRIMRHCIGLNHVAIGIENVGDGKRSALTKAQQKANEFLVRSLAKRFPITHLIGHYEYRRMESHPYFSEADPKYRTIKIDPGQEFLHAVRQQVSDLSLLDADSKKPRGH